MKGTTVGAIALATAGAVTALGLSSTGPARASSVDNRLQIGQSLHFVHGPGSSTGSFLASGAIKDAGTVASSATLTPKGDGQDGTLTGTETFTGHSGTFTTAFTGTAGPSGEPHEAVKGTFQITSGTGDYAGLSGHGSFLIVVDIPAGQLVRTDDGQVS